MDTMSTYRVENTSSGHVFGIYEGDTENAAIAAMLRDAGYAVSLVEDEIIFPDSMPENLKRISDLEAVEVNPSVRIELEVDRASIGLADVEDAEWSRRVRFAMVDAVSDAVSALCPTASVVVTAVEASADAAKIETDYDGKYEAIKTATLEAIQRGYDNACAGR